MKLRNKYTSKVVELEGMSFPCDSEKVEMKFYYDGDDSRSVLQYDSFDELKDEWEKYEEPKEYWYIDYDGGIISFNINKETAIINLMKRIGNCLETKEEAEKAVEKLKAWKRLKDKGFRFDGWHNNLEKTLGNFIINAQIKRFDDIADDLDICFGGKE